MKEITPGDRDRGSGTSGTSEAPEIYFDQADGTVEQKCCGGLEPEHADRQELLASTHPSA